MKVLVALLLLSTLSFPIGVNALAMPQAQVQKRALFLSSLNATRPMGYYAGSLVSSLNHAGYNVTYLADGAVTISLLLTRMKNYSVVVWRTDSFTQKNATYWYVGEKPSDAGEQRYASDFAAGRITTSTGMVAVSTDFFTNHFGPNALQGVKLLIFVSSNGNELAPIFLAAGVTSVVFSSGAITLQFGLVDDLTAQLVGFLTQGETCLQCRVRYNFSIQPGRKPERPSRFNVRNNLLVPRRRYRNDSAHNSFSSFHTNS